MDKRKGRNDARREIIDRLEGAIARIAPHPELVVLGGQLAAIREIAALELTGEDRAEASPSTGAPSGRREETAPSSAQALPGHRPQESE
ncbi:hypothetical protein [Stappia sp. TSB10GB4]|uniref:hypothetical protein n=1 Tax=Stappia sp. TSB10GB4 TaxID=2003584 RepID=UPI0016440CE9|nr:hypothetical protein [Stappia sp. TSB10GB4]